MDLAPGAKELRDSPQRWWLALLLSTGMIACYAHRGSLSVAAPVMMKELGLSPGIMGILLSAFFWSYSFMQMPAGWLVDRYGVRRAYGLGYLAWSLTTSVTGFARSLAGLILIRVSTGVAQATAFPASARAVANWFQDRERGVVTATYLMGVRLGQALVSWAGAIILAAWGYRALFLVVGLVPLVWLLPWHLFLRRHERPATGKGPAAPASGASFGESLTLFRRRSVIGIFLGFFAYDYAWFVYVSWLPAYLMMERHFGTREMGIYSAVPYMAMSAVILLSGALSDFLIRRGLAETAVRKTLICAGLLAGCLIVPAGMVEDNMTAVWLLTISLCGLGIATPNTWTLTQAVCARGIVGTVSGIQNFGGNLGGILAPALTGFIAQATHSFALAMALTGIILLGGVFSYSLLIRERVDPAVSTAP